MNLAGRGSHRGVGIPRRLSATPARIATAAAVVAAVFASPSPPPVAATTTEVAPMISTFAGGPGWHGPPTSFSQTPYGVAVVGSRAYVADAEWNVVRSIDLARPVDQRVSVVVAGNGIVGDSADGAPATATPAFPTAVAADAAGNLYIAENCRIRKLSDGGDGVVDATGEESFTTVAGTPTPGSCGYAGDGGAPTAAKLGPTLGMDFDAAGRIYISDYYNCVVWLVADGVITKVVGIASSCGFSGDGGHPEQATLWYPNGVAVDSDGTIYIADAGNSRVRQVTPGADGVVNGGADEAITTLAGGGLVTDDGVASEALVPRPLGVAFHEYALATGQVVKHLYISQTQDFVDPYAHKVRRVDLSVDPPAITTVAGVGLGGYGGDGGPARSALLFDPRGLALDAGGNVYVADSLNGRVRRVDAATAVITTVSGNGLLGGDQGGAYGGDGGPATSGQLNQRLWAVAVDPAGNTYVADSTNYRVRRVDATTGVITTAAGNGKTPQNLLGVRLPEGDGGPATDAPVIPYDIAVDSVGRLYIAETGRCRVRRVENGIITTVAGNNVGCGGTGDGGPATAAGVTPQSIALDGAGNIYIGGNCRVRKVDPTGIITTVAGSSTCGSSGDGGAAGAAELPRTIAALAVDGAGRLYVSEPWPICRIRRVDLATSPPTIARAAGDTCGDDPINTGDGGQATAARIRNQTGRIAVDPPGNLYIQSYCSVRKVDLAGVITTVVGPSNASLGDCGFAGDGGRADQARLQAPEGLAVACGALYVGDGRPTQRVRRVTLPATTTASASVDGLNPTRGPAAGGTSVSICGRGLSGATGVRFGSANAASFKVVSDTKIVAVSPPGAAGVEVSVTTPAGTTATTAASRFEYLANAHIGRAAAVAANVADTAATLADTGPVPPAGGARHAGLATVSSPKVPGLAAEVGHATTIGQGNTTRSEASLSDLSLAVGDVTVSAEFAMANATATCSGTTASTEGTASLVGLAVNGQAVPDPGVANHVIPLPEGWLVLNEQTTTAGSVTVNALHLVLPGVDVAVGSATAGMDCGGVVVCADAADRITGGGWTTGTPSGGKGHLGVAGGTSGGEPWGHVTYHDKAADLRVKSTAVSGYSVTGPASRRITGSAEVGGATASFTVDLTDNSASGTADTFSLHLSTGYAAAGPLGGGNIALHLLDDCGGESQ